MSDTVSEAEGCKLLARMFRARGYAIKRNVAFDEYGVSFHVDGWDAAARVGFEFLSSEQEDHVDLSLAEYKTLMDAQQRGELALFILDEVEELTIKGLSRAAAAFLDDLQSRRPASRRRTAARPASRQAKPAAATRARDKAKAKVAKARKAAAVKKKSPAKRAKPVKKTAKPKATTLRRGRRG